jgi:hypothetical protein
MKFRVAALACLYLVGGVASAQAPPIGVARYEVVAIIDHEGALGVTGLGLNERGQVAGWYTTSTECDVPRVSFVWSNGEFEYISVPDVFSTTAEGINNRGYVTGGYFVSACEPKGYRQAFVMSPGGEFRTLPWTSLHSIVTDISNNGWMTGPTLLCEPSGGGVGCQLGFLYNGRDEPLFLDPPGCRVNIHTNDVNARGEVVGSCQVVQFGPFRGYKYADGSYEFIEFPGATSTQMMGINEAGHVIGFASMPDPGGTVNFIRRGDRFESIELTGVDGLASFRIHQINSAGMILGSVYGADGRGRGFLARRIQ